MIICIAVLSYATCFSVDSDTPCKILDKLSEIAQQCFLLGGHSKQQTFYLFSTYKITDSRLLRINTESCSTNLILSDVDFVYLNTLSGWTT